MIEDFVSLVRDTYSTNEFIPLHAPTFSGREKELVLDTLASTFVSSVGKYVDQFENNIRAYTNAGAAIATMNGTAALHAAMYCAGVTRGDLVVTQSLTFVATCNAISYLGADPVFVDVSDDSLGMCPTSLESFLVEQCGLDESGNCMLKSTGRRVKAVVPMHTFGHPVDLDKIMAVCTAWNLTLIEDAAESLGSYYKSKHTGTIGSWGALSFNGNKIITTGGGGIVLCSCTELGKRAKHITTTAKLPHPWEFNHDEIGFNYRMPNINAAVGCAQMDALPGHIKQKRKWAARYADFFKSSKYRFNLDPSYSESHYW